MQGVRVGGHGFVLMDNHYHLLIETNGRQAGRLSSFARNSLGNGLFKHALRESTWVRVPWLAEKMGLKTRGGMDYLMSLCVFAREPLCIAPRRQERQGFGCDYTQRHK